jgi:tetratricopeptide (TPR) repeat protein
VHYAELALRVAENRAIKASLRYDLAIKLFRAGLFRKAIKHGRLAARYGELTPIQISELLLHEIDAFALLGRLNGVDVETELERVEAELGSSWDPEIRFQRLKIVVRAYSIDGRGGLCSDHRKQMALIAHELPVSQQALALSYAARSEAIGGASEQAVVWARESEDVLDDQTSDSLAEVKANLAAVYYLAGEYQTAYKQFSEALALFQSSGDLHHFTRVGADMVALLVDTGRFVEARRLAAEIHASWSEDDSHQVLATTHANLAVMQCDLGDYQQAQENAERALECAERGAKGLLATIHALLGIALLENGSLSLARTHYDWIALHEKALDHIRSPSHALVDCFVARYLSRRGDTSAARQRLVEAAAHTAEHDFGGWLRLRLELAKTVRRSDPLFLKNRGRAHQVSGFKSRFIPDPRRCRLPL